MSNGYDNRNKGALFRNDRKTQPNHPSHTGRINVEGVDYWLSAWVKESPKGKFFSLSVTPVEGAANKGPDPRDAGFSPTDDIDF